MKKFSWILALLAALALVFVGVGCSDGGGGGGGGWVDPNADNPEPTGVTVKVTHELTANQYGEGYQIQLKGAAGGFESAIAVGDYYLRMSFYADRSLDDDLQIGLVDTASSVGYWKPLSWSGEDDMDTIEDVQKNIIITKVIKFTTTAAATSLADSTLVFQTEESQSKIGKGVKLHFITLEWITEEEAECCEDCEEDCEDCLLGNCADNCEVTCCMPEGQEAPFVAVTNITYTGQTSGIANNPVTLSGTVAPQDATNKTIVWSTTTSGASVSGTTLTATSAGTVVVTATIENGETETTDYTQDFNITIVAPATDVKIIVAGDDQNITPVAEGNVTSLEVLANGSGYVFDNGNYDGGWVKFNVDLGDKTLKDFASVKVTVTITGADAGWKNVGLLAANKTTGLGTPPTSDPFNGALCVTNAPQTGAGASPANLTLNIDQSKAASLTENELEIAVYGRAPGGYSFEFKDIEFILGDICDDCDEYPCSCTCDRCGENPCICVPVKDCDLSVPTKTGNFQIDVADKALIDAAPDGSFVRLVLKNTGSNDRTNNGVGHFGNVNITVGDFGPGVEFTIDLPTAGMTTNANLYNDATIVTAEIWILQAP